MPTVRFLRDGSANTPRVMPADTLPAIFRRCRRRVCNRVGVFQSGQTGPASAARGCGVSSRLWRYLLPWRLAEVRAAVFSAAAAAAAREGRGRVARPLSRSRSRTSCAEASAGERFTSSELRLVVLASGETASSSWGAEAGETRPGSS